MKLFTVLLLTFSSWTAFAERVPLFAYNMFGATHIVMTRNDESFLFEECKVKVRDRDFLSAVNTPGLVCRERFPHITHTPDMEKRVIDAVAEGYQLSLRQERIHDFSAAAIFAGLTYSHYAWVIPWAVRAGKLSSLMIRETAVFLVVATYGMILRGSFANWVVPIPESRLPEIILGKETFIVSTAFYDLMTNVLRSLANQELNGLPAQTLP